MSRRTQTTLYGLFIAILLLIVYIAYAQVVTELKIEGEGDATEQKGVYITDVEYLSHNGADTTNSKVNYYLGTMLDSKVVLGSSSSSTITYKVTVKNNTDREQVFIGIVKDDTDEEIYSNTNIQPNVATAGGITGITEYETTIAPGEYITFPVTYAYAGTDTANSELQGKINFRFREKPILDLSNEGETYTLENIYSGSTNEYEFTVSNYNENYNNGIPLIYTLETELTEGSPLEAKIYDSEGNEVTESVQISGDKTTQEDHTYTLKIIWDESLDSTEYEGKEYSCNIKMKATPDDQDGYQEYAIEKEFDVEISTCTHSNSENGEHNYVNGTCTICGEKKPVATVPAGSKATKTSIYSDGTDAAVIPEGFTVSGASSENVIDKGLVIYLIQDKTETEIANIAWNDPDTLLDLKKTYDQFVWIPIPKANINDMYMCQSEDGTKSCNIGLNSSGEAYCSIHSSTAMAGRLYAATTGNNYTPTLTTQTYIANNGLREPAVVTGNSTGTGNSYDASTSNLEKLNGILGTSYSTASNFLTDLQSEYNEIVKSIYENEGFYIGRYETSGMVSSNTNVTIKVVAGTKHKLTNITWYRMYAQQKKYAENIGLTGSIGSTMIQGAAYDQVMKFIDPTTSFVKTTGRVSHDLDDIYQTGGLNYSGTITYNDVAKNIYDLEGNVYALTTEAGSTSYRVNRGGDYGFQMANQPSNRGYEEPYFDYITYNGSVCQLYLRGVVEEGATEDSQCTAWKNGFCTICGKECPHEFENAICTICGYICTHNFANGACTICGQPDAIPISTVDQLLKIGSNEEVTINGVKYIFSPDADYELQNNITFTVADYISQYSNAFNKEQYTETEIKEETVTNQVTPYATANSTSNQYYTYTAPGPGTYKLEVWGAQGGYQNSNYGIGGLGGYSVGTITLDEGDNLYVYVGQKGGYTTATGNAVVTNGYNGGGGASYYGGTGGGATDIRFTSGTWNNSSSLLSRVIVAGGGGRSTR